MKEQDITALFEKLKDDIDAFFACVSEDVDWTVMGTLPLAGRYRLSCRAAFSQCRVSEFVRSACGDLAPPPEIAEGHLF
jgi:ketosteroid isomerase-like protein